MPRQDNINKPLFNADRLDPQNILGESLAKARLTTTANEFFLRWPEMRHASINFAAMLTREWPEPDDSSLSLLDNCLSRAFAAAFEKCVGGGDEAGRDAYIHVIADGMERSTMLTVCGHTRNGLRLYDPLESQFSEWILDHRPRKLDWSLAPHRARDMPGGRLLYAGRIFRLHEIELSGLLQDSRP